MTCGDIFRLIIAVFLPVHSGGLQWADLVEPRAVRARARWLSGAATAVRNGSNRHHSCLLGDPHQKVSRSDVGMSWGL